MNNISPRKPKFSVMIQTENYQKSLHNALSNPREIQKFTAAITSVVSTNPQLEECEASTILSSALCGHSLQLAPSPQLGQYYMVPFKCKAKDKNGRNIVNDRGEPVYRTVATFVLGYRGYIQLAIRSGQYKKLNVLEIKEGELVSWDPLAEEIKINLISDETERELAETIGYYAMFEYVNGFKKAIYWSKDKMKNHAIKYSNGYANDVKKGYSYTFWSKDFDGMAKKTMLRQLISKWGIMSVEMQNAYISDGAVLDDNGNPIEYSDDNDNMIDADVTSSSANSDPLPEPPMPPNEMPPLSLDDLTD